MFCLAFLGIKHWKDVLIVYLSTVLIKYSWALYLNQ